VIANVDRPGKIVLDANHVYWTDFGEENCNSYTDVCTAYGAVNQASLDGSNILRLASNQDAPYGLAVDANNVYWVDSSDWIGKGDGTVDSVPIGGGTSTLLESYLGYPYQISVYNGYFYWSTGQVNRALVGGGGTNYYSAGSIWAGGLAVGSTGTYWEYCPDSYNNTSCTIGQMGLDGTNVTTFATGLAAFSDLAIGGSNLYWVDIIGGAAVVRQAPLAGGATTTVGVASSAFTQTGGNYATIGIAVDATAAYVNIGSIVKVPLAGGAATTLVSGASGVGAIAVNGTNVYFMATSTYQLATYPK
jgi:hypothetical protein